MPCLAIIIDPGAPQAQKAAIKTKRPAPLSGNRPRAPLFRLYAPLDAQCGRNSLDRRGDTIYILGFGANFYCYVITVKFRDLHDLRPPGCRRTPLDLALVLHEVAFTVAIPYAVIGEPEPNPVILFPPPPTDCLVELIRDSGIAFPADAVNLPPDGELRRLVKRILGHSLQLGLDVIRVQVYPVDVFGRFHRRSVGHLLRVEGELFYHREYGVLGNPQHAGFVHLVAPRPANAESRELGIALLNPGLDERIRLHVVTRGDPLHVRNPGRPLFIDTCELAVVHPAPPGSHPAFLSYLDDLAGNGKVPGIEMGKIELAPEDDVGLKLRFDAVGMRLPRFPRK